MGLWFNRRTKILPGVSINLGKRGISTSIGPRGAKVTIGSKGVRSAVGIPGTGVSYTKYRSYRGPSKSSGETAKSYLTVCPSCGHHMRKAWDHCPECGVTLIQSGEAEASEVPMERTISSAITCPNAA